MPAEEQQHLGTPRFWLARPAGTHGTQAVSKLQEVSRARFAMRMVTAIGMFLVIGAVALALFVRWRQPPRITTAELLVRLPRIPPPLPLSIHYSVTFPTLWHLEHCSLPGEDVLSFRATAWEYQSYQRNPSVSFLVNRRGTVDQVKLLRTSGSSVLDQRILAWLRQRHFAVQKGCEFSWRGNGQVNVEF